MRGGSPESPVAVADAVLAAHPLDAYARLMLPYACAQYATKGGRHAAAKAQFSRLALLLHPDRCGNPRAGDAFAAVTASWRTLCDQAASDELDAAVSTAADELRGWRRLEQVGARSLSAAAGDLLASDELDQAALRERVAAVLTASESKRVRFSEQMGGAEAGRAAGDGERPLRRSAKRRARKGAARRRGYFVKPADPTHPTRHLHVANTGPAFGISPAAIAAAMSCGGWEGAHVSVVGDDCPFVYVSFASPEQAAAARARLDRRSPSSELFLGRVVQAEFAEAALPMVAAQDMGDDDASPETLTPQQIVERLRRSLMPGSQEDEAGELPELALKIPPTTAPVRCPLCLGDPYATFGRGRAFRMHLKSPVHSLQEGPLMLALIELAGREADIKEAKRRENGLEGEEEMGGGAAKRAQLETSEDLGLAAARDGQLEELHRLVAAGWDPLVAVDRHGSSALHFAAGAGHLEVCQFLVDECGVPASQACTAGRQDQRNALHWAARNGHLRVCHWLVCVAGVDINSATTDATNAFHWAVWQAQFEVARWLVDAGCNWAAVNDWGCTAVHWAGLQGDLPMLCWLRSLGLDPSHTNRQGHSALHKAAYKGHAAVARWLVSNAGVDPRLLDQGGYSPAVIARMQHHEELAAWLEAAEQRARAGGGGSGATVVPPVPCGLTHAGPLGILVPKTGEGTSSGGAPPQ
eukprot:jgi/Tetstr1/420563/TSEL_011653.t1